MILAAYLVNKPSGFPLVVLIVAITLFVLAGIFAGWGRQIWQALIAVGLGLVVLALLTH